MVLDHKVLRVHKVPLPGHKVLLDLLVRQVHKIMHQGLKGLKGHKVLLVTPGLRVHKVRQQVLKVTLDLKVHKVLRVEVHLPVRQEQQGFKVLKVIPELEDLKVRVVY